MKAIFRWIARVAGSAAALLLVILLLPHAIRLADQIIPDTSALGMTAATTIAQNLDASARLETALVTETGVIDHKFLRILPNTYLSNVTVHYEYRASIGIDLQKVQIRLSGNELTFILPAPEILADSLLPLETVENTVWAPDFGEDDFQQLLTDKRTELGTYYLTDPQQQAIIWSKTTEALESTIAKWISNANGRLTFQYELAAPAPTPLP